jgi:hypothetical protein
VNDKALIFQRLQLIMKSGVYELHFSQKTVDFEYKKYRSKNCIMKHWQTSKTLFHNSAEYDTTLLNSILEIPKLDNEAFTNMIRYAKLNNFKDINV